MINKEKLIETLIADLDKTNNETQIIEVRNSFLNKQISPLYKSLVSLSNEEKSKAGQIINELKNDVIEITNSYLKKMKDEADSKQHVVNYDILIDTSDLSRGALNPITLIFKDILSYFQSLNFTIQSGEEIMDTKYNFDNLNIPKTHPTRETSETFYTKDKSLRTQNTASSAKFIDNNSDEEIRIANFGYVYRNDEDDQTHSHQFNQIDFIWVKKGLNVKNLKWVIDGFIKKIFGNNTKSRYRLSNFPFTEPSFEVDASCPFCNGHGCNKCKQSGWIELLGAGIMREEVLNAANIKGKNAIACGLGVERIAMIKYGINDVRDFYTNDFRFLKQFVNENIK